VIKKLFQIALWAERNSDTHRPAPDKTTSENLHVPGSPSAPKERVCSNTLSRLLLKLSNREGQYPLSQPCVPTLRRDRDTEKDSVRNVSTWTGNERKNTRTFNNLIFSLFI
jgi:hypothetical protein